MEANTNSPYAQKKIQGLTLNQNMPPYPPKEPTVEENLMLSFK